MRARFCGELASRLAQTELHAGCVFLLVGVAAGQMVKCAVSAFHMAAEGRVDESLHEVTEEQQNVIRIRPLEFSSSTNSVGLIVVVVCFILSGGHINKYNK